MIRTIGSLVAAIVIALGALVAAPGGPPPVSADAYTCKSYQGNYFAGTQLLRTAYATRYDKVRATINPSGFGSHCLGIEGGPPYSTSAAVGTSAWIAVSGRFSDCSPGCPVFYPFIQTGVKSCHATTPLTNTIPSGLCYGSQADNYFAFVEMFGCTSTPSPIIQIADIDGGAHQFVLKDAGRDWEIYIDGVLEYTVDADNAWVSCFLDSNPDFTLEFYAERWNLEDNLGSAATPTRFTSAGMSFAGDGGAWNSIGWNSSVACVRPDSRDATGSSHVVEHCDVTSGSAFSVWTVDP